MDLARLAAVTGEPDVRRATANEARELTGFTIGGIPPIGHVRPIRVVMDPDLGRFPIVWAAAGTPTAVFPVAPGTLRMLANANVVQIAEDARARDAPALAGGHRRARRVPAAADESPSPRTPAPDRRSWSPPSRSTRSSRSPAASGRAFAGWAAAARRRSSR